MTDKTLTESELAHREFMAASQALKAVKKELRSLMKARLSQIPKSSLESQSKAAFQALISLERYKEAKRISVYLSMPSGEIQTDEIVRHAMSAGKEVFIPYLHRNEEPAPGVPKTVMDMVKLGGLKDYESLERDSWGIPTVTGPGVKGRERILVAENNADVQRLDLILLPGVAFELEDGSRSGGVRRLGHGKGFYDYFLHRYRNMNEESLGTQSGATLTLYGLALKEQLLQGEKLGVPMGPHDTLLDGLIVGDGQKIQVASRS